MEISQEHVIVTSSGYTIKILGIPQTLFDAIQASKKYPSVPTYAAATVADPSLRLPHEHYTSIEMIPNPETGKQEKKETLHSTLTTDEDKKVWAEYKAACDAEDRRVATNIYKAMMLKGIEVTERPASDANWEMVQTFLGVALPSDPIEKMVHWLSTEVLRSNADLELTTKELLRSTGMSEEQLSAAMGSFRNSMERQAASAGVDQKAAEGKLE